MGKDGSIAPKERVNIVYKPATGDAQEEIELPLKLLVMGDFTLRADDRALEDREPMQVDKDNFNQVLKDHDLELGLNAKNTLSGEEDDELGVKLKFESLKDFDPESVARQVPELKQLLELREALTAVKGQLQFRDFKKKIESLLGDEDARKKLLDEVTKKDGDGE